MRPTELTRPLNIQPAPLLLLLSGLALTGCTDPKVSLNIDDTGTTPDTDTDTDTEAK